MDGLPPIPPGTPTPRVTTTDEPILVFEAPYFTQIDLSTALGPAIEDYLNINLPILLPPYIDPAAQAAVAALALLRAGDTATGAIMTTRLLATLDNEFATKLYVDTVVAGGGGGIGEAPALPAGELYLRQGSTTSWVSWDTVVVDGGTY